MAPRLLGRRGDGGPFILAAALTTSHEGWRVGYLVIGGVQITLAIVFLATLPLWRRVPERTLAKLKASGAGKEQDVAPPLHGGEFNGG